MRIARNDATGHTICIGRTQGLPFIAMHEYVNELPDLDTRLKLLYFVILAAALFLAESTSRIAILTAVLASLLVVFRRICLRRPYALIAMLLIANSVFVLHCFFSPESARLGHFTQIGCSRGAQLALTIISLWAAATLLFGSERPRELARAVGCFLPFDKRSGSFSHSFISLILTGLLVFPVCKNRLVLARTAARARGGWFRANSAGQSRHNLENAMGFALRRFYLASDDITGQLAARGYSGPDTHASRPSSRPIGASDIIMFAAATTFTVAILLA